MCEIDRCPQMSIFREGFCYDFGPVWDRKIIPCPFLYCISYFLNVFFLMLSFYLHFIIILILFMTCLKQTLFCLDFNVKFIIFETQWDSLITFRKKLRKKPSKSASKNTNLTDKKVLMPNNLPAS